MIEDPAIEEQNPAHYCYCGKYLGFRGFCSEKCHKQYYDFLLNEYANR